MPQPARMGPPGIYSPLTHIFIYFFILGDDFDDRYCKEYVEIKNLTNYKKPEYVNDISKRPLGFQSATIPFVAINPNARNPCFKIFLENSTQQTVQVLVSRYTVYYIYVWKYAP